MWHVSISLQRPGAGFITDHPRVERIAIDALAGVGGDLEWWMPVGESHAHVSHLRVPTTPAEQQWIPPGLVTMDAGPAGTLRPRTR